MTSNNETVSRQKLWAGNIAKSMTSEGNSALLPANRELKMGTFSGQRRPDRQRKPGTEAAVASRQKSNIKIAVNSEGRRL